MSDVNVACAHEGKVLGPSFGLDVIDEAGNPIEPPCAHVFGTRQTERNAMNVDRHPARQRLQRFAVAAACIEVIVGDDLQHVDPVERIENPDRQFGTPADACAIGHQLPQPPQPPPPPPQPLPPLPQDEPQLVPPSFFFLKCCTKGNAAAGTAAAPNNAVNQSNSREPLPGLIDDVLVRR